MPLEHDPEKACPGLDPGVDAGFRKRSCSANKPERDDENVITLQSSAVVGTSGKAELRLADVSTSAVMGPERMCGSMNGTSPTII